MTRQKKKDSLTDKEEQLMHLFWEHGPLFVKQLVELLPEPKPHFNTVSTFVRILEKKGFVSHNEIGGSYQYYAVARMEDFRRKRFGNFIKSYFVNSYFGAVSTLVEEEKISADELRELLELIEKKNSK